MDEMFPKVYAVRHINEKVVADSRSGGIFTAVSDYVLNEGGVVYGCALTKDFNAVHIRADSQQSRNAMRGSKYIQSELGDTLKNVKKDLIEGRLVLFTGTSCQVAGLIKFLGKKYNNLICVDIVCHGVPSVLIWKKYIAWREEKFNAKVISVDFRNKKDFGWRAHIETLYLDNGKKLNSQVFTRLFYGHTILRPCCYTCHFKKITHPGDITIADYWGVEKAAPEFDDNKGTSLVLINNTRGADLFQKLKHNLQWKKTKIEDSMQEPLIAPFPEPDNRMQFWQDLNSKKFSYIAKRYGGAGCINYIKELVRKGRGKMYLGVRKIKRIVAYTLK